MQKVLSDANKQPENMKENTRADGKLINGIINFIRIVS